MKKYNTLIILTDQTEAMLTEKLYPFFRNRQFFQISMTYFLNELKNIHAD